MPQSRSYYRYDDKNCDAEVTDRPLVVNCAGQVVSCDAFTSCRANGRSDFYLIYITGGALRICLRGEWRSMRAGDAVLIPPHTMQHYIFDGGDMLEYYWAHFTGSAVRDVIGRAGLPLEEPFAVGLGESMARPFRELMALFFYIDEWQEGEAAGQMQAVLAKLGRAAAGRPAQASIAPIRESLSHMHEHYDRPLSVAGLAAIEHVSVSRYTAMFRACTGQAPKEYLIALRMRNAMDLLLHTDLPVKQVAAAVGYDDPLYFSRLFKKRTGTAPSELRGGESVPEEE